jgi:hypothetical protein
MELMDTF